jgi:hypothetical protein
MWTFVSDSGQPTKEFCFAIFLTPHLATRGNTSGGQ